ncbi:MAG: hypothetical protein ACFFDN_17925 [Candidatus Hodarchaeota archaeon]
MRKNFFATLIIVTIIGFGLTIILPINPMSLWNSEIRRDIFKLGTSMSGWTMTEVVTMESTEDSSYPTIAVDGFGNVHVAWYESTGNIDILYKRWNAATKTWTTTVVVSTESTGISQCPTIAVDGSGNVHVAWHDGTNYGGSDTDIDIFYKRWNATTKTWTVTEVVSTESTENSFYPTIAVDDSENVHVAWEDRGTATDWDILYKRWNGTAWNGYISATDVVSTESTTEACEPTIAVDSSGNVHLAWYDDTSYGDSGIDLDIFYKRWNGATWGGYINATDVVSTESNESSCHPTIAVDGLGNVHVAWEDLTNYGGSGTDYDIFYKRWNGATWGGYINATDVVSTEGSKTSNYPTIAVDGSGNVHVAWEEAKGLNPNILYKRWNGATWSGYINTTDVVSTESTSETFKPAIAVDGSGNVHVAWEDTTNYTDAGTDYDIFYKCFLVPSPVPSPSAINPILLVLLIKPTDIVLPVTIGVLVGVIVLVAVILLVKKRK